MNVTSNQDCPNSSSSILVIIIFIFILIILGVVIWFIVMMRPKNTVPLFGACTHQNDCAPGLVCSTWSLSQTGSVCLEGISGACDMTSDCATGLVCTDKVCVTLPTTTSQPIQTLNFVDPIMLNSSAATLNNNLNTSVLEFNHHVLTNNIINKAPMMQPITSLSQLQSQNVVFAPECYQNVPSKPIVTQWVNSNQLTFAKKKS